MDTQNVVVAARLPVFLFLFLLVIFSHQQQIDASRVPQLTEPLNANNDIHPDYTERIVLVTVLNRHGDRAPTGTLAKIDKHAEKPNFFWPNG